jgi:hypothetical protein
MYVTGVKNTVYSIKNAQFGQGPFFQKTHEKALQPYIPWSKGLKVSYSTDILVLDRNIRCG